MRIEQLDTKVLIPYARNAKLHNEKQVQAIAGSIQAFGFNNPILVDKENGIIAGHGRVLAAQLIGMKKVPCVRLDHLSETDKRAYIIADNRLQEIGGGWDQELLSVEVDALVDVGFDTDVLQVDDLMIESEQINEVDAEAKIEISDELAIKWGTALGQLWLCGEHKIYCGDSALPQSIDAVLSGHHASIVFTDPPYGVSIGNKNKMLDKFQKSGRNHKDIECDNLKPEELKAKLIPVFMLIKNKVMADDCTVFVTAPQGGELGMMMMMMQESGLRARHVLIWKKNSPTFSMGRLDYDYQHEPILLTWGKKHKRPMMGQHKTSVWEIAKPRSSKEHPTMKPVELYVNALLNNSDKGDIAFDAYSGSGTMIIACEQTGRKARVIEIDPGYVAVALQRWADATGKNPVLTKV